MADSLVELRKRLDSVRIASNLADMENVHGKTTEELVEMDLVAHQARLELAQATIAYGSAIENEAKARHLKQKRAR